MVSTSCLVLRGGLAVAVAVLASSLSGTIAVAQQIAVNVEGQAAQEASAHEEPDDAYARQIVPFHTSEAPGTIIIDTSQRYLYLVQPNDQAISYGIGVGRIGFQWSGTERVSHKQKWPGLARPAGNGLTAAYLPRFIAGGQGNPLGARALYLGHSVFRIHGTNRPETIGHAVSSGCFRLGNADVIDLYDRVPDRRKSPRQAVGPRFLMRTRGLRSGVLCGQMMPPPRALEGHARAAKRLALAAEVS